MPTPCSTRPLTGLILAGGRGHRMGGRDKGLIDWKDRPLIDHVLERLAPQVDRVLIVANRHLDDYAGRARVVSDQNPGHEGPLAGLLAGLTMMDTPFALVVPVDAPLLPLDLAQRLQAGQPAPGMPCVVHDGERQQPLFGLYDKSLVPLLQAAMATGERKLMRWLSSIGVREVRMESDAGAFSNVNTPDDLEALRRATREFRS